MSQHNDDNAGMCVLLPSTVKRWEEVCEAALCTVASIPLSPDERRNDSNMLSQRMTAKL